MLHGPAKWTYFYLYVILDIYSRHVVGWMLAPNERATLAQLLIDDTVTKHSIDPYQITFHADRGSSMASKPVAFLLADLGITKSHSRPHVPSDNPFSESQFKTMKYRPDFPKSFDTIEQGRGSANTFSLGTTWITVSPGSVGIPRQRPLRHRRRSPPATGRDLGRSLPIAPRTSRVQATLPAATPHYDVDQQTRGGDRYDHLKLTPELSRQS